MQPSKAIYAALLIDILMLGSFIEGFAPALFHAVKKERNNQGVVRGCP